MGPEMLRVLMASGYEPELIIQEVSELAGVERELWRGWPANAWPRRVAEQVRERVIPGLVREQP